MAFKKTSTITPFEKCIYLSSPTMHGDEARYMMEAYETNWMSTVGKNMMRSKCRPLSSWV